MGLLAVTSQVTMNHAQEIREDSQSNTSELAHMFALRESIEDFPLPLKTVSAAPIPRENTLFRGKGKFNSLLTH